MLSYYRGRYVCTNVMFFKITPNLNILWEKHFDGIPWIIQPFFDVYEWLWIDNMPLSPLHYSLIRRLLFNNMGLLWPPMLSVKWSFRPFSASWRISVAVSEQCACSAASCSPREMCSMPPFHSVSFYPVSQSSWFSEGGKKNCIAHHFWCIVLAFF